MSQPRNDRKASITITFPSPVAAAKWFRDAQDFGLLQTEAAIVQKDGLDEMVGTHGVPGANEFIVRRASDRPYGQVQLIERPGDHVVVTVS